MENKIRLNLGCGIHIIPGWINVDNYFDLNDLRTGKVHRKGIFKTASIPKVPRGAKFVRADIRHLPFSDEYSDEIMLDNVLEHICIHEVVPTLKEIRRIMKTGSKARIIVPSFDGLVKEYLNIRLNMFDYKKYMEMLFHFMGIQNHEGEYHRCLFTAEFFTIVLNQAGFTKGGVFLSAQGQLPTPDLMPLVPRYIKNGKVLGTPIIDYLVANAIK